MYDGKYYPNILSGSGYVMTRSVAECLYKASLMLPYLHLEDVLVTGNQNQPNAIKTCTGLSLWLLTLKFYKLLLTASVYIPS